MTPGACIGTDHSPQPSYINHFLLCDLLSEIISPEVLQGNYSVSVNAGGLPVPSLVCVAFFCLYMYISHELNVLL